MEALFIHHEDYSIETVKSKSVFKPKVWSSAFGKSLKRSIIEAKIIHTHLGLTLPLKTFAVTPKSQTVEFAGFHGYNERSEHLMQHLQELKSQLLNVRVTRIDIAIDYEGKIPKRVMDTIKKYRPRTYDGVDHELNTTYYKTPKEKKVNQKMDIKIYNKQVQAGLDYPLYRLEFVFKGSYFKKLLFKDIETAYQKMEKSIKKATGLSVKIQSI
ncbi:hypothetical protein [Sulfurovum lithotrophicum]|nr:hypothetical protein [Sulfurovum lithotrophicum]